MANSDVGFTYMTTFNESLKSIVKNKNAELHDVTLIH
jgi:hypothetical protein